MVIAAMNLIATAMMSESNSSLNIISKQSGKKTNPDQDGA
jgi:hypothetical protein